MTQDLQTEPPAPSRFELRRPGSTTTIIVLIATMLALTIAAVLHISSVQHAQSAVREETRLMRMTRQAMMELDRTVLRLMTLPQEDIDPQLYGRAVGKLETFGTTHLPATVTSGGEQSTGVATLDALKSNWQAVARKIQDGSPDQARDLYHQSGVDRGVAALIAGFASTLDDYEKQYEAYQRTIDVTTWLCLAGQLLTGLFSMLVFLLAARRGAKEAKARERAVMQADATREQVMRLFQMTDVLQSAADHMDANAVLRSTATELLPDVGGALYVFNNSRDRLALSTHWGMSDEHLVDHIGLQQCWALKRGKPHVNRPDSHKLCCEHHQSQDHALEIPMIARGEILGLMQFHATGETAEARLDAIAGVGQALSDAMSLALANLGLRDKLRSQALRDPLTGLYNRRYMEDTLERLVRLGEREKTELSLIMIDLDHFKRLNDNYGHAKGDAVLRDAASVIIGALRESDVACRYGGEELLVILPQCGLEQASLKAERLRAGIESLSEPNGAQVTASFGVASIPMTSGGARELLADADAALYLAKQGGRNRVSNAAPTSKSERVMDAELLDAAE